MAAVAIGISGVEQPALADVTALNPLDPALNFNAFIEGDTVLAEHEMEGPLATGGTLAIQGIYEINTQRNADYIDGDDAEPSALVVGGSMDWNNSTSDGIVPVLSEGYMKFGDLTGSDVLNTDQNDAPVNTQLVRAGEEYNSTPRVALTVQQPIESVHSSPIDFASAFAQMRGYSEDLAVCANTVTMLDSRDGGSPVAKGEVQPGQQIFVTLTEGQTNVLNVTGEDLNNISDLTFVNKPSADTPILINVDTSGTGGVFNWDVANQAGLGGEDAPYILWNFNDTVELTLTPGGSTVEGSIFAPDAYFTDISEGNIEGQIVAADAVLGTTEYDSLELHYYPFAAELTCETDVDPSPTGTTEVPTTDAPTTDAPTTDIPTTDAPTTDTPTSEAPSPEVPSSEVPSSEVPSSETPASPDKPGGMLPTTGTSLLPLGAVAALLFVSGTAALVLTKRRRRVQ